MATRTPAPDVTATPNTSYRLFTRFHRLVLIPLIVVLVLCIVFSWTTRDAMNNLSFLQRESRSSTLAGQKTLVDVRPWQTAQALAALAVSTEELEHAREAERLADHEVDQAFAAALRQADTTSQPLNAHALALKQKVSDLQQTVKSDQALLQQVTAASHTTGSTSTSSDDVDIAKAQLGLDSDQLNDAEQDLARASGDQRTAIQQELAAHEATMKKYDSQANQTGELAVVSSKRYVTLAHRLEAWSAQRSRYQLLQLAKQQAESDSTALMAEHHALELQANAGVSAGNNASGTGLQSGQNDSTTSVLAKIKQKADQHQLLSICNDRYQTQQQLASVYANWSAQVLLQHRIVLHLILQSLAMIAFTLILVTLCDLLIRHFLERPTLDRRRTQTLQKILELSVQLVGVIVILLIVFGAPQQMPTILGLATAGITVVMQDFILAFFGWFVLMGKNGIRIGDIVEINGVDGEVSEIGLFRTSVMETGNWTDKGHPTGRRVTFINKYAISGQYFNFSTTGQWMWDEITVSIPTSTETYPTIERIHKAVLEATEADATQAEAEWKRNAKQHGLSQYSATPAVNLRPSGSGIDVLVRYVTRASERVEMRNRLYQCVLDALQPSSDSAAPTAGAADANATNAH